MAISGPSTDPPWPSPQPGFQWNISSVKTFKIINLGATTTWVTPGWYKRATSPEGIISLLPMRRWRLWRHRALWGFSGLVDGR